MSRGLLQRRVRTTARSRGIPAGTFKAGRGLDSAVHAPKRAVPPKAREDGVRHFDCFENSSGFIV